MKYEEVYFIEHCDDPQCDLGYAEFACPSCGKYNNEYGDLWWDRYEKDIIETKCEYCDISLIYIWQMNKGHRIKIKD